VPDLPIRPAADPQWIRLHRAADLDRPALARVVLAYLTVLAGNMGQARRMLQWFDVERTIAALKLEQLSNLATAVEPILRSTWERGLAVAAAAPPIAGTEATLLVQLATNEGLNIERIDWARRQAGELIQGVSMETRYAVRRIIEAAVARGTAPRETGKLLEAIVGLTERQAQAVARYRATLVEAGTKPAILDRLVARYGTRLLRHRAQMIARTETIRAANEGRRAQWQRNVQEGVILPERWEREWVAIVPSDGRTCSVCVDLDGQRAPIDGTYPDGSDGPPGHPVCRCTESLVRTA
jgi:SPP1 gp7 family putative phage head morphogenesis protein